MIMIDPEKEYLCYQGYGSTESIIDLPHRSILYDIGKTIFKHIQEIREEEVKNEILITLTLNPKIELILSSEARPVGRLK